MNNPNLAILELVAKALGPVCDDVVFVGGCATGLLLTLARPERIRITEDVDIIAQALTARDYHAIEAKVRAQGFSNDMRPGAPICRWLYGSVTVDVMPTFQDILGFANRWYPLAVETATTVVLESGMRIRLISAPVFIATKLEAFIDRGHSVDGQPDYLGSHDLEDIVTVVDRRPELLAECADSSPELRAYLAQAFSRLLADADFNTTLAGHLPGDASSQGRLQKLRDAMREFANLKL
jgi:predicted nucleotidyltransferase